jgi:hypothetical protein
MTKSDSIDRCAPGRMATVRRFGTVAVLSVALLVASGSPSGQESDSSRMMSATVVSTYVARGRTLALLVLWRGSPGWHARGGGRMSSSSSGGGRTGSAAIERSSASMTFGGRTLSIELDYRAQRARLLEQDVSLADTNVVLVDSVDGPEGGKIVGLYWVDPTLPTPANDNVRTLDEDPAVVAIRRSAELGAFLQCDVPMPPARRATSQSAGSRDQPPLAALFQKAMTQNCRAAIGPG